MNDWRSNRGGVSVLPGENCFCDTRAAEHIYVLWSYYGQRNWMEALTKSLLTVAQNCDSDWFLLKSLAQKNKY